MTLSDTTDQATAEDAAVSFPVLVGSARTGPFAVSFTAFSTNTALLPAAGIVFSGGGSNRTVTLRPATNQFGTTLVTLTAHDGFTVASDSFLLTVAPVNDAPTLDPLPDQDYAGDVLAQTLGFTNVTTGATNEGQTLSVTVISSVTAVVPTPTVTYTSPNATGSLSANPTATIGVSTVTVTVNDGGASNNLATGSFLVYVRTAGSLYCLGK